MFLHILGRHVEWVTISDIPKLDSRHLVAFRIVHILRVFKLRRRSHELANMHPIPCAVLDQPINTLRALWDMKRCQRLALGVRVK